MKTNELIGSTLDWAVAKCENTLKNIDHFTSYGGVFLVSFEHAPESGLYSPSTDWAQGGPIIEREGIGIRVHCTHNNVITSWAAEKDWPMNVTAGSCGPTPLIAAMRCFVASKLGDEIEIP